MGAWINDGTLVWQMLKVFQRRTVHSVRCLSRQFISSSRARVTFWRKWAWRAIWMPYAALFALPASLGVCAAYHHTRGDTKHARGYLFYAWTSFVSLPVGLVILLTSPIVIATDPYD